MRVVCVAGYSDSGKTTLVERLVPALGELGSVATVKSIHHDVEIDAPGKDTYRHREAGAETVVGVGPSMQFQITKRGKDDGVGVADVLDQLEAEHYDFVVVEGFKESSLPMVLVGDIEAEAVGGSIVYETREPREASIDSIVEAIRKLPEWA